MIYIAHRGNIDGPCPDKENHPEYLLKAIDSGFHVECDLWLINNDLYLGHDSPDIKISIDFLISIKDMLFCHCKNIEALYFIITTYKDIECFFHDNDDCVLTSKNHIWTYTGKKLMKKSICVMPERVNQDFYSSNCYGVCTDYPIHYSSSYNI